MRLRTETEQFYFPFSIHHKNNILFIGSCFSNNIGDKLDYFGLSPVINPFGIAYNPYSIFEQLTRAIDLRLCNNQDFFINDEVWKSFDFHSDISGTNLDTLIKNVNDVIIKLNSFLKKADFIFLTFGTSNAFKNRSTDKLVANNHKIPMSYFEEYKITPEEIVSEFNVFFNKLNKVNNSVKIILTVSPVRHKRLGLVENNRSKARLLNSIEKIVDDDRLFYFPAYEILVDDLRDYRFYESDLVHPNVLGIEFIWKYFCKSFFDDETLEIIKKIEKIKTSFSHRPFYPESLAFMKFKEKLTNDIENFNLQYPYINLDLD